MVALLGVTYPDLKVIDPLTDLLEENEEVILQLDVTPGEERSLVLIHPRLFVKYFRELELSPHHAPSDFFIIRRSPL